MKNNPTIVLVAAVALVGTDGRVLMQQRAPGGRHGGLWEFPGGKLEPAEPPEAAAIREIYEELGVVVSAGGLAPVGFAADPVALPAPLHSYVILLYTASAWLGEPRCLAGTQIDWFAADALAGLEMPPLDYPLAAALVAYLAIAKVGAPP